MRLRSAVFFGFAVLVLITGIYFAAFDSTRKIEQVASSIPGPGFSDTYLLDELRPDSSSAGEAFVRIIDTQNADSRSKPSDITPRNSKDTDIADADENISDRDLDEPKNEREKESEEEYEMLLEQESFWHNRLTYPTGRFDPSWVRQAAAQDSQIERGIPTGRQTATDRLQTSPLALDPNSFTALGPKPERMTGCVLGEAPEINHRRSDPRGFDGSCVRQEQRSDGDGHFLGA